MTKNEHVVSFNGYTFTRLPMTEQDRKALEAAMISGVLPDIQYAAIPQQDHEHREALREKIRQQKEKVLRESALQAQKRDEIEENGRRRWFEEFLKIATEMGPGDYRGAVDLFERVSLASGYTFTWEETARAVSPKEKAE
ncbi:MAG TPA: hypothetical protein VGL35_09475 [Rhizomicrobium sp.]|jgi:hypothetical protein